VSTDGLFVPLDEPTRFLDTRTRGDEPDGWDADGAAWLELRGAGDVEPGRRPGDVAAVAVNVTVTDPLAPGYVTLTPAGANDPAAKTRTTATVSVVRAAQTLPSHAIVGVSPRGFDVFAFSGAHVIATSPGTSSVPRRPRRSARRCAPTRLPPDASASPQRPSARSSPARAALP
jgi:hypothetical protein